VKSQRGQGRGKLGVVGGERGQKKQSNPDVGPRKKEQVSGRGGQSRLQAGWGLGEGLRGRGGKGGGGDPGGVKRG